MIAYTRIKLIAALVLILVFAAPLVAGAECAWVLWQESSSVSGKVLASGWSILGAHSLQGECEKRQAAEIAYRLAAQGGEYGQRVLVQTTVVVSWPDGRTSNWKFLCLPDTVDPRGPK